jgi:excisionase family DNA binding protein
MNDEQTQSSDKLLRKSEAADRLACSIKTVEREMRDGNLTRIKVREGVRVRESEVNIIINGKKP